jgi:hypothetical protein
MNGARQSSKFDPPGNRGDVKKPFRLLVEQYPQAEDDGLRGLSERV